MIVVHDIEMNHRTVPGEFQEGDPLAYFHHVHLPDKVHHCGGDHPGATYRISHCPHGKHAIDQQRAIGHGVDRQEVTFAFTEPCGTNGWHVESGVPQWGKTAIDGMPPSHTAPLKEDEVGGKIITFPPEEHDFYMGELAAGREIHTLRVQKDFGRFFPGDIVTTEWGQRLLVTDREVFPSLREVVRQHPYYQNTLSQGQVEEIEHWTGIWGVARLTLKSVLGFTEGEVNKHLKEQFWPASKFANNGIYLSDHQSSSTWAMWNMFKHFFIGERVEWGVMVLLDKANNILGGTVHKEGGNYSVGSGIGVADFPAMMLDYIFNRNGKLINPNLIYGCYILHNHPTKPYLWGNPPTMIEVAGERMPLHCICPSSSDVLYSEQWQDKIGARYVYQYMFSDFGCLRFWPKDTLELCLANGTILSASDVLELYKKYDCAEYALLEHGVHKSLGGSKMHYFDKILGERKSTSAECSALKEQGRLREDPYRELIGEVFGWSQKEKTEKAEKEKAKEEFEAENHRISNKRDEQFPSREDAFEAREKVRKEFKKKYQYAKWADAGKTDAWYDKYGDEIHQSEKKVTQPFIEKVRQASVAANRELDALETKYQKYGFKARRYNVDKDQNWGYFEEAASHPGVYLESAIGRMAHDNLAYLRQRQMQNIQVIETQFRLPVATSRDNFLSGHFTAYIDPKVKILVRAVFNEDGQEVTDARRYGYTGVTVVVDEKDLKGETAGGEEDLDAYFAEAGVEIAKMRYPVMVWAKTEEAMRSLELSEGI